MVPMLHVRPRLLLGLLSLLVFIAVLVAPMASAKIETIPASGEFSVISEEFTVILETPEITIVRIDEEVEFTGTMKGEAQATARCIIEGEGQGHCFVVGTFEGSVDGRSGTARLLVQFEANLAEDSVTGNALVLGTSGELAGALGQLSVEAQGGEGTYEGEFLLLN